MKRDWDMIRLFESINKTTVKGNLKEGAGEGVTVPIALDMKDNITEWDTAAPINNPEPNISANPEGTEIPNPAIAEETDDYDSWIKGRQDKRREVPFSNIVQFFNHYKLDVKGMNPDVVREVYVRWEDEAEYDGVSDMEENPDGSLSVELDGVYGKHWMPFKSDEEWQEYYQNHVLADAREAFDDLYKKYESWKDAEKRSKSKDNQSANTLGTTHGDVLSRLKNKMLSMGEANEHLQGKRVVLARDLKAGDHIVGLGKGLLVTQGAVSLPRTQSGKVELVVKYPDGKEYLKVWNKQTKIQIYEKQPEQGL